ncbi:uncharacterized protein [Gossypium hirsutum]|uniref:Uncharacterized protein n=1 Tax=Gossypium hirsutum TaxID=3635 RepID=A0A1U8P824_GOSHI|nr:uncharacterized protein LOC107956139 [Gossypium hirsutum]
MLKNKLPPRLKDPRSFTIPCSIGNHYVGTTLCDFGASINLMPMSIFRNLGIGKARPTTVTLQLVDRSYVYPEGKIEDVLVRVDKFIFPAGFIILECEADKEVPIILGRPFLATGGTLIDVQKEYHTVEFVNVVIQEEFVGHMHHNSNANSVELTGIELNEEFGELMAIYQSKNGFMRSFESLDLSDRSFNPYHLSIEDLPVLELKPLPVHLKYTYLGDNDTLHVVISAEITVD